MSAFVAGAGAQDQSVVATSSNQFSPAEVTVNPGDIVTFSNAGGNHNVHFDDGTVDNPANPSTSSWSFSHTFDQLGDFRYYCEAHGGPGGEGMAGIVHVVAAPPANPPSGGGPPPPEPGGAPPPSGNGPALKVTLKVSDATPLAGRLVRLSGVVTPARDGRKLQIQKRLRGRRFKTIATTRLRAAKGDRSIYSIKLRLSKDAVLRARVAADDATSRARKLDVRRAP